MAFISMIIAFLFLCLCGLGVLGLILLIIGLVKRAKNKKTAKKSKAPMVLIILGTLSLLPITSIILISMAASIKSHIENRDNLCYQVKYGTARDVERLLIKGVSPECERDNFDKNVVAENGDYTVLFFLCYQEVPEHAEKMQLLIKYGADINRTVHLCDYTPEEHLGEAYEEEVGYNDSCGQTPLMEACRSSNYEAVKILLEHGADVNARDYCGETPLIYVVKAEGYGQLEIVKLLLKYGADKNISGRYSGTALEKAKEMNWPEMENALVK